MEKLSWFKFTPSDWIMGKIQRCPEVTQARFMRLCCVYWNKDCNMTYEDAEVEIDKEHLDILISKRVLKSVSGIITITFLLEQIKEIEIDKIDKSQSGQIGNLKRWHRKLYDKFINNELSLNQAIEQSKLSHPDSTPITPQSQNIAEESKRREEKELEKKREDKTREDFKKEIFNFKKSLIDFGFEENLVSEWMLVRKNKKATNTKTTFQKFINEIELASEDKNEILKFIIEKDWKSFEYQWLINLKNEFNKNQEKQNGQSRDSKTNEQLFTESMQSEVAKNFRFK